MVKHFAFLGLAVAALAVCAQAAPYVCENGQCHLQQQQERQNIYTVIVPAAQGDRTLYDTVADKARLRFNDNKRVWESSSQAGHWATARFWQSKHTGQWYVALDRQWQKFELDKPTLTKDEAEYATQVAAAPSMRYDDKTQQWEVPDGKGGWRVAKASEKPDGITAPPPLSRDATGQVQRPKHNPVVHEAQRPAAAAPDWQVQAFKGLELKEAAAGDGVDIYAREKSGNTSWRRIKLLWKDAAALTEARRLLTTAAQDRTENPIVTLTGYKVLDSAGQGILVTGIGERGRTTADAAISGNPQPAEKARYSVFKDDKWQDIDTPPSHDEAPTKVPHEAGWEDEIHVIGSIDHTGTYIPKNPQPTPKSAAPKAAAPLDDAPAAPPDVAPPAVDEQGDIREVPLKSPTQKTSSMPILHQSAKTAGGVLGFTAKSTWQLYSCRATR